MGDLNPEVFQDLQSAEKLRPLFEAAGLPLRTWEAYAFAFNERTLLRRELTRLSEGRGAPSIHPEVLERLQALRSELDPLVEGLRPFLPPGPRSDEEAEFDEMVLGFIAISPTARDIAQQWVADPQRYRTEAAKKLQIIETVVQRYRSALRAEIDREISSGFVPPPQIPLLPAPGVFEATATNGEVTLIWSPVAGAMNFILRRATMKTGPWKEIARPAEDCYSDTGLPNATTFNYTLTPVSPAGIEGASAGPVEATPQAPPPIPVGLSARPGNASVALRWMSSPGAIRYRLLRATSPAGPFSPAAITDVPAHTDRELQNGQTYFYAVASVNPAGESPACPALPATPVAPPPAPGGFQAQPGNARVTCSWLPVPGALRYRVVRRPAAAETGWTELGTPAQPPLLDASVANGTTYEYAVHSINAGGEGPASPPVSATPVGAPETPRGLRAQAGNGEITLDWTPVAGAVTYAVRRSPPSGDRWTLVAQPAAPPYTDTGLPNGQAWVYTVAAQNAGGESPPGVPLPAAPCAPPSAPPGLEAHAANGRVTLTWRPAPGADRYLLKRAAAPGGPFDLVAAIPGLSHLDGGLPNHATVYYTISAANAGGESTPSAPVAATPVEPPAAPADVTATAANARIRLDWSPVPGAQRYRVMRSTTPGGPYTAIASPSEPSHVDADVSNGLCYYYVIRALNVGGKGPHSPQVEARPVAAPPAPESLLAHAGNGQVALSWNPVAGATQYALRRWPEDRIVATPAAPSFIDTGVSNGTTYRYAVLALNAGGEGPASAPVEATPLAPPSAPTGLSALATNARVALSWTPPPRAAAYLVRRAAGAEGLFETIGSTEVPSFIDPSASNGTLYSYRIIAVNAAGEGEATAPVGAQPQAPPPAPTGLVVSAGNGQVSLSWIPSPRAATYRVLRRTGDEPAEAVASPVEPRHHDAGLENGRRYRYVILALNTGGESAASAEAEALPLGPPGPVGTLEAGAGNGQVSLIWLPVEGAGLYVVRRAVSAEGPFATVAKVTQCAHVDGGLSNGTTYYYSIAAQSPGGEGPSAPPTAVIPIAPPAAPTGLSASPGSGQVTLTWAPAARAAGYLVKRSSQPGGAFAPAASTVEPTFVDVSLQNGTAYRYVVSAVNRGGESPPSAEVTCTPIAPPAAPAAPTAAAGSGEVLLQWDPVPGADYYRLKRAVERKGPYATIGNVSRPRHLDAGLQDGTTYYYVVSAVNGGGRSAHSPRVAATPQAPPPAPRDLLAVPGSARVTLKWSAVEGATTYSLKRAARPGGPYQTILRTPQTSAVDTRVENDATYFYVVRAGVNEVKGAFSPEVSATPLALPAVPSGLRAVPGPGSIRLSWTPVPGASTYIVRRSSGGRDFEVAAHPDGPAWEDLGLMDGVAYAYTVAAENSGGEGAPSAPATSAAVAAPAVPTGLRAVPSNGEVTLGWSPVPGASRYRVKRASRPAGPFATLAEPPSPLYTDTKLANGVTLYYAVSALNAHGESPDSYPASTTPVGPPPVPEHLSALPGPSKIALSWSPAPFAVRYRIMRADGPGGPYTLVGSPRDPAYTDCPLENGRPRHYVVSAVNAGGESANSTEVSAVPQGAPMPESAGTKTDEVPTLESIAMPQGEQMQGIDYERLLDLRRVEQLRSLFEDTAQKFEEWEVLALIAEDGTEARRSLESLLRLKRQKKAPAFTTGAVALFERILRVRAQHGAFARKLRLFLAGLDIAPPGPDTLEIALGFLLQAPKGRQRMAQWLENPEASRSQASAYMRMTYEIAERYRMALASTA